MRISRGFCIALALWIAAGAVRAESGEQEWLVRQLQAWQVSGVAIAVARGGGDVRAFAAGTCDLEGALPCTADSRFHIGSITKSFTGLLASSLAIENQLALEEPVALRWPGFRLSDARWKEITLRDLLSGRSGIASIDWPYFWEPSATRNDYLERLAYVPMARPFRTRFWYANSNFVAAGEYMERVTGTSWEQLVRERIFSPLQMGSSGFNADTDMARGYALVDGKDVAMPPTLTQAGAPAGAIVSSARDMSHWLAALVDDGRWKGKQVWPTGAGALMRSSVIGTGYDRRFYQEPGGYGLGVFVSGYHERFIVHHGGGYAGYTAHFAWLPRQRLAVAVLTNRNATLFAEALCLALVDREFGDEPDSTMALWLRSREPDEPVPPHAPPDRPLESYAGEYVNPAWGVFRIDGHGQLLIHSGRWAAPLHSEGQGVFSFAAAPGWERLRLRFDATGFDLEDGVLPARQHFTRR